MDDRFRHIAEKMFEPGYFLPKLNAFKAIYPLLWAGYRRMGARMTNLVHDFSPDDFKNNVLAFAESAKYFRDTL